MQSSTCENSHENTTREISGVLKGAEKKARTGRVQKKARTSRKKNKVKDKEEVKKVNESSEKIEQFLLVNTPNHVVIEPQ